MDKEEIDGYEEIDFFKPTLFEENEQLRKTGKIFEEKVHVPIQMSFNNDEENLIESDEHQCRINIPVKEKDGTPRKTAVHHELGHYFFDTPMKEFQKLRSDLVNELPHEYRKIATEVYTYIFNTFEDQRVESLMGQIYAGTNMRFVEDREQKGKKLDKKYSGNPVFDLYSARLGRNDLCKTKEAKKLIKMVERKDVEASLIVTKEYVTNTVKPYLLGLLPPMADTSNEAEGKRREASGVEYQCAQSNRKCDHRNYKQRAPARDDVIQRGMKSMEQLEEDAMQRVEKFREENEGEMMGISRSYYSIQRIQKGNTANAVNPNYSLAHELNRAFRRYQQKRKFKIREEGEEISIPHVIERKARGWGDQVYKKEVHTQSVDVILSIDGSGSMSGYNIQQCRDMIGTMYKSIENLQDINIKCVVWSGGGRDTQVIETDRKQDIPIIDAIGGSTPTDIGVRYSKEVLRKTHGRNKVMFLLTDGEPTCDIKLVKDEIIKAGNEGINIIGVFIGHGSEENMRYLFGDDNFVICNDVQKAQGVVMDMFDKLMRKYLKGKRGR